MPKTLALDPGTRRIGVAVSNTAGTMAFPRPALDAQASWIEDLREIVIDEEVDRIIVGEPRSLKGVETASTEVARSVARQVGAALPDIPVITVDERLTTVTATRLLYSANVRSREQRGRIDSASAVVILQGFLDGSS